MPEIRQPASAALAVRLDLLIEAREQHVASLMGELAHARQQASEFRELRELLSQALHGSGSQTDADSLIDALHHVDEANDATSTLPSTTPDRSHFPDAAKHVPSANKKADSLRVIDVFLAMKQRPGQVFCTADLSAIFPDVSRKSIGERLARLARQGKITKVSDGQYRYDTPKGDPSPYVPLFSQENHEGDTEDGTLREQILTIMRTEPTRGWWPRDLIEIVKRKNPSYLRTLLRAMVNSGQLVQDDAKRYWLPRPSAVVADRATDNRQVNLA
ncbi:hypothetical protein [Amycolatopsis japonica]|uniref:hypothetical protein n=1 Tax=Amycolatopsis japonica TaxID=208439 RepID=UPI0038004BB7